MGQHLKEKLKDMWESKEYHKKMALEGQTNLDKSLRSMEEEREKTMKINQELVDDSAELADRLMEAEQDIKDKDEKFKEMVQQHERENEARLERYEAESEKNNGEILQLKTKLSISDQMAIK